MFVNEPPHSPAVEAGYDADLAADGYVMNSTRLWIHRTDVQASYVDLRSLLTRESTLSERELAVLVTATASARGDPYCSPGQRLAHLVGEGVSIADTHRRSSPDTHATGLLSPPGLALSPPTRTRPRRACAAAPRDCGLTDREVFEAACFVAFRLAFSTVDNALGAEPDLQLAQAAPASVREAVSFGRPVATSPS